MGTGTFQAPLTIDFSPGGNCNIVDEPGVFTFNNGTANTPTMWVGTITY